VLHVLSASTPDQLAALALTIAAEAAADRSERANDGDLWLNWWKGVDSPNDPNSTAMYTSPSAMWRTLRPERFDSDSLTRAPRTPCYCASQKRSGGPSEKGLSRSRLTDSPAASNPAVAERGSVLTRRHLKTAASFDSAGRFPVVWIVERLLSPS